MESYVFCCLAAGQEQSLKAENSVLVAKAAINYVPPGRLCGKMAAFYDEEHYVPLKQAGLVWPCL